MYKYGVNRKVEKERKIEGKREGYNEKKRENREVGKGIKGK